MRKVRFLPVVGAIVMVLAMPLSVFADPGILSADLQPTPHEPHASGSVEFQSHSDGSLRLSVAVAHVASTQTVAVLINGDIFDFIELDHTGAGHLFLNTDHGDDVPELGEGDVIQIVDAFDAHAVLLEGTLAGQYSSSLGAFLHPTPHEPHASGTVQFESQTDPHHGTLKSLSVAVTHVASTQTVAVLINGDIFDFIELDHTGAGHLFLSTAHGDDVPDLSVGDVIQIVDAFDGHTLLLEGTLAEYYP